MKYFLLKLDKINDIDFSIKEKLGRESCLNHVTLFLEQKVNELLDCLTSYGDDGIEALIPEGEIKVVTHHDFTSSTLGNLNQWPTVVTAQGIDLAVHFKIFSSPTTYKRKIVFHAILDKE